MMDRQKIAEDLMQHKTTVLKIVESMQSELTSKDLEIRKNGTKEFCDVIGMIPHHLLDELEVSHLGRFLIDRLKDQATIIPHVVTGLVSLTCQKNLSSELCGDICRAVFKELHVQAMPRSERAAVFRLLDNVVKCRPQVVRTLGNDFLLGFIQSMDGERDPRNLIEVFDTHYRLANLVPLDSFGEDMFEVVACYFPVDFTPREEDGSVTREQLSSALHRCLVSSPAFAEHVYPLIIEKLESDSRDAKRDSLRLLADTSSWGRSRYIVEHAQQLAQMVAAESAQAIDPDTAEIATSALEALFTTIPDVPLLYSLLDEVFDGASKSLFSRVTPQSSAARRILSAALRSSPQAASHLTQKSLDLIHSNLSSESAVVCACLEAFSSVLNAAHQHRDLNSVISAVRQCVVQTFPLILSYFGQDENLCCSSCKAVTSLVRWSLLSSEQILNVLKSAWNLISQSTSQGVSDSVTALLYSCLDVGLPEVRKTILSLSVTAYKEAAGQRVLDVIKDVAARNQSILIELIPSAVQIITGDIANNRDLCEHVIKLVRSWQNPDELVCLNCVTPLVTEALSRSSELVGSSSVYELIQCLTARTGDSDVSLINSLNVPGITQQNLREKVAVLRPVLCSISSQAAVCCSGLVQPLLELAVDEMTSANITRQAAVCCCGLVNKLEDDAAWSLVNPFATLITQKPVTTKDIIVLGWLLKALYCRSHPKSSEVLDFLLTFLFDETHHKTAAESIGIILEQTPEVLSTEQRAQISLFYTQRLYIHVAPRVMKDFRSCSVEVKGSLLQVLSYLLVHTPAQVVSPDYPQLLPLLMQSLSGDEQQINASLGTLVRLLHTSQGSKAVEPHISSLVPTFIRIARGASLMKTRTLALECLRCCISSLAPHHLLPMKTEVINGLQSCLDDRKRLVRRKAVHARNAWFMLGAA